MQLDGPARITLKKYLDEQVEEVKNELLYPHTELQTATLRGRFVQLESMLEILAKQEKPTQ
ncbi:hypothetical protein ACF8PD_13605 [Vibrio plantisponsor]|uniref:hypothetical protein n=1 Tax=Vibrio plantisponsor TaxID=664643 RepID=UPI00370BC88F